jgi:hypothetical protein
MIICLTGAADLTDIYGYNYTSLNITSNILNNSNQQDTTYSIKLVNTGETLLRNINLNVSFPMGLQYVNSSVKLENRTNISGKIAVTWNMGTLDTNQSKNIILNARKADPNVSISVSNIYVEVQSLGKTLICKNGTCQNKTYPKKKAENGDQIIPAIQAKNMLQHLDRYYKGPGKVPSDGRKAEFNLEIKNTGRTKLNVSATNILPTDMKFISCKCMRANSIDDKGNLIFKPYDSNRCKNPTLTNCTGGTNVTWNLGELIANDVLRLEIVTNFKGDASKAMNTKVYVVGESQGKKIESIVKTIDNRR